MEELQLIVEETSKALGLLAPLDFQTRSRNPGINEAAIKAAIIACAPSELRKNFQSEVQTTTPAEFNGKTSHRFADLVYTNPETSDTIVIELKYIKPESVKGCNAKPTPPALKEPETFYRKEIPSSNPASRYADVMMRYNKTEINLSTIYQYITKKPESSTSRKRSRSWFSRARAIKRGCG